MAKTLNKWYITTSLLCSFSISLPSSHICSFIHTWSVNNKSFPQPGKRGKKTKNTKMKLRKTKMNQFRTDMAHNAEARSVISFGFQMPKIIVSPLTLPSESFILPSRAYALVVLCFRTPREHEQFVCHSQQWNYNVDGPILQQSIFDGSQCIQISGGISTFTLLIIFRLLYNVQLYNVHGKIAWKIITQQHFCQAEMNRKKNGSIVCCQLWQHEMYFIAVTDKWIFCCFFFRVFLFLISFRFGIRFQRGARLPYSRQFWSVCAVAIALYLLIHCEQRKYMWDTRVIQMTHKEISSRKWTSVKVVRNAQIWLFNIRNSHAIELPETAEMEL